MKMLTILATLTLFSLNTLADDTSYKSFGETKVYYSAFNSSFIDPTIASTYNISRGKDKGLVNIAIVADGSPHGQTALVSGTVNNLLAQRQQLEFFEVREGDAVYYLAPFTFANEDPLNFTIEVQPASQEKTHKLNFKRTFYHDN